MQAEGSRPDEAHGGVIAPTQWSMVLAAGIQVCQRVSKCDVARQCYPGWRILYQQ